MLKSLLLLSVFLVHTANANNVLTSYPKQLNYAHMPRCMQQSLKLAYHHHPRGDHPPPPWDDYPPPPPPEPPPPPPPPWERDYPHGGPHDYPHGGPHDYPHGGPHGGPHGS